MKTFDIDDSGFEFMQGIRRCGAFVYREDISEGEKKMKIFDKKDVFTIVTAEDAKNYIGKKGYLSDTLINLQNRVDNSLLETLDNINELRPYPFSANGSASLLFLPANKVKVVEKPKKWRPFKDLKEFIHTIKAYLGDSIIFRYKEENEGNSSALITSFSKELYVTFGGRSYSYEQLFYYLEWFDGNTWQPFGVLDES